MIWNSSKQWFEKAIEMFERPLTRYLRNMLKNLESAQDLTQEAYLRLWKNGPIEFESPIRIWLYKTSRNLAIDLLRKEGKMHPMSEEDEKELLCPNLIPSQQLEQKQIEIKMESVLNELPEKHKEVLRLKFQEDLSYKEISAITGHSVNHVGVLIHQAVLHMRQSMESKGDLS